MGCAVHVVDTQTGKESTVMSSPMGVM